jgi:hypothetical protein
MKPHLTAVRNALRMLPVIAAVMAFGFAVPPHSAGATSITQEATGPLQQKASGSIQQSGAGSLQVATPDDEDDKFVWVCMTIRGVRVCFPVPK